jgi:hemolysin activation/secretion protein
MANRRFSRQFCARLAIAAVLFLSTSAVVLAQTGMLEQYKPYDRYRYLPRLPQGNENPPPLPSKTPDVKGDTAVLVDKLKGMIFVDDPKGVVAAPGNVAGIVVRSENRLQLLRTSQFQQVVAPYLSGPISMHRLNEMAREIILFYRHNDQPVVDVSYPEQDITEGVLQIVVREGRVGKVRVDKACFFNPCVLADQLSVSPGGPIYESMLLEDQRWLYRNPFRTVDMELTPGTNPGDTDVLFHVNDRRPVRLFAGYEDTGTAQTGLERTLYGVNWYNALGRDDQAGYQYTAGSDFQRFNAHSAFYSTALENRDILTLYWGYGMVQSPLPPFDQTGYVWQLMPRWTREVHHDKCVDIGIDAGFDVKQSNTNLDFGGVQIFASPYDVRQFTAGCTANVQDRWGTWNAGVDGYYSPGGWGSFDSTPDYQKVRAFSNARYFYARAVYERHVNLPDRFEFVARMVGQMASTNLMPTEQLGLGGYNSVRGYDMYDVVGDSGYFVNLEVYTPTMHLLGHDDLKFLAFYDFANAYNHTLLPGEATTTELRSVGVGARYVMKPHVEVRFDYGWQLDELTTYPTPRQRPHVGAVLSW